ncbi:MAG: acyl-CoA/acyl-ACP dehydrogenase [Gammaproteobacteria bacterium]|nr:acyl-CoA/acyl-ACP dehydrogenase [Gammaproteobacteria bacterium]
MNFELTEEQQMLRDSVRKMMDTIATPEYIREHDEQGLFPYEVYDKWVKMGLLGLAFPEKYGGAGGDVLDMVIIGEELGRKGYDFVGAFGMSIFNGLNVLRYGTETQKKDYIPKIINGEIRLSISMTEPDAGSDVGAMRTTAVKEGNEWVINGQKVFSTAADSDNNIISLYVKTDPGVHHSKGVTLFLVPKDTPGVTIRKLNTLGRRMLGTNEIFFDNVRIPDNHRIGDVNKGWKCLLSGLQFERLVTIAGYAGNAQTVVDDALAYAKERKQFGRSIGEFQAIAHMLADMQTQVSAARMLMLNAAVKTAKGEDALMEISQAKLFGSETFANVANQGMQIMGGYSYMMEFPMQRHYRDARSTTITAGTSQMQRNVIANLMGLKVK